MKNLTALIILVFIFSCADAQEIEWQKTIGGNGEDSFNALQKTKDGGYIFCGGLRSNISGDKTENSIGGYDVWIVKTDSLGNIQWQNTIGGSGDEGVSSMEQTSDEGYILGCTSNSNISGDKTENCIGATDFWIVKLDSIGNIQWQNTIGGSNNEGINEIHQTTDNGYIFGGTSRSNISGDKIENCSGYCDMWIIKTDSIGNIQWQNTIGGNAYDYLTSIKQTNDGGYVVGGSSCSNISGDKTENAIGGYAYDYWIIKLNSNGIIQWQKTIGGDLDDSPYSIQQTSDGGYIIGGISESNISGNKTENCIGDYDYWIVKIDSVGNVQWQNTIGGNNTDFFFSLAASNDGGFILCGRSLSNISGDKTENNWSLIPEDIWIVKIDSFGNIQWQNTIGGSGQDGSSSIQQTNDGGYILAGVSSSNISGDKTENCKGGVYDCWVIKLNERFNTINGTVFYDFNINGIKDSNDIPVKYLKVTEANTGRFGFSGSNGYYPVSVPDSGNYSVSPEPLAYYNSIPANRQVHFTGFKQTNSSNDFALQPNVSINDLSISIYPVANFTIGFDATYCINYKNIGTTVLSATILLRLDTHTVYVSSSVNPLNVTTDSIIWSVFNLPPTADSVIYVTVHVTPTTIDGTWLTPFAHIEPSLPDNNPFDNSASFRHMAEEIINIITGYPYDPNAIVVDKNEILSNELNDYREYIIYFQNTGTDTAINIKILNPIDTQNFQLNTFEFLSASYPVDISYVAYNRIFDFRMNNVLLPDSNVNEPMSHGYIRYGIKPNIKFDAGDTIPNQAFIYFDHVDPVATNYATVYVLDSVKPYNTKIIGDNAVCKNDSNIIYTVNYKRNHSYQWQITGGIILSGQGTDSVHVKWTANGWKNIIVTECNDSYGICDSNLLPVKVKKSYSDTAYYTLCAGDSLFAAGNWQYTPGTYVEIYSSTGKCDSLFYTFLSFYPAAFSIFNFQFCEGDSIMVNGTYYSDNATFADTLVSATGCDSLLQYIISKNPSYNAQSSASICQGDSIFIGSDWQTNSGNYTDSLFSIYGCDSVIQTALSIDPVYSTIDTVNLLQGDSIFLAGAWQTVAGVYSDNFQTQAGCDSAVTTVVNIITSVEQFSSSSVIVIKPNPSSGMITIELNIVKSVNANLIIQNMTGQVILKDFIKSNEKKLLDVSTCKNGVYIVKIIYDARVHYCKMVKE